MQYMACSLKTETVVGCVCVDKIVTRGRWKKENGREREWGREWGVQDHVWGRTGEMVRWP